MKIKNSEAEIKVIRASQNAEAKPSFSEEISSQFGHHFHMIKNLEIQIKSDFCKTLYRYERDREQALEEVEKLKKENEELRRQNLQLTRENKNLNKFVGEVQPDLRPTPRMG